MSDVLEIRGPTILQLVYFSSYSRRPWSHISLDFVTCLLESDGNTTIQQLWTAFLKWLTHTTSQASSRQGDCWNYSELFSSSTDNQLSSSQTEDHSLSPIVEGTPMVGRRKTHSHPQQIAKSFSKMGPFMDLHILQEDGWPALQQGAFLPGGAVGLVSYPRSVLKDRVPQIVS